MVPFSLIPLLRPLAALSCLALASCALGPQGPPKKAEHVLYEWFDDYGPGEVKVKIPFINPAIVGKFPYHCHILEHEDGGMMANLRVTAAP